MPTFSLVLCLVLFSVGWRSQLSCDAHPQPAPTMCAHLQLGTNPTFLFRLASKNSESSLTQNFDGLLGNSFNASDHGKVVYNIVIFLIWWLS